MALSVSHGAGAKGYAAFSPDMDESLRARQDLETAMQQAMERGEISLMFQPQVSLEDNRIIGVEALMRWMHPELGAVSPDRFIPVAEETGKIVELGRWIMDAACREVATWPGELKLSVNVSPVQFELIDVVDEIRETLGRSGLPANRLDVEITEGVFVSNAKAITASLQRLRDFGVGIALDDFGTGYSSLSYLGQLPVDKIKIDQSFVKRLPADQEAGRDHSCRDDAERGARQAGDRRGHRNRRSGLDAQDDGLQDRAGLSFRPPQDGRRNARCCWRKASPSTGCRAPVSRTFASHRAQGRAPHCRTRRFRRNGRRGSWRAGAASPPGSGSSHP